MFGLSSAHILLVIVVILVVFGAAKLPQIGKSLGEGIKNFKKSVNDSENATDITPMVAKKDENKEKVADQTSTSTEDKEKTKEKNS